MFPMVPYHRLPELHVLIKDQCPPAYPSLTAALQEMIPTLIRQTRDPAYFVPRSLADSANQATIATYPVASIKTT